MIVIPPYLKQGDCVGIISTARKISKEEIKTSVDVLHEWGFRVRIGENLHESCNQYAGTDEQRAADLQSMIDDPDISLIWCARGGYGSVKLLDKVDFSGLIKTPKWIAGYSDVTVLLSHIVRNYNTATIHSTMPINVSDDNKMSEALISFKNSITGIGNEYVIGKHSLNRAGKCCGELVGGNLSILYSLSGTESMPNTEGKILFIEDLDEYLYHIDRMMMNLKRSGKLKGLKGLIIGGMSDMNDNAVPFGYNAEEIIKQAVEEYDYPVCFGFPAGHIKNNYALTMGVEAELIVEAERSVFKQK